MMTTNVPPIEWTDAGFVVPSGPEILAGVQEDINQAFGRDFNFALNTPQGQLASSWAATISNFYALLVYYSNQTNPAIASGRMQDAIAAIYFLQRNPAEPTTIQVQCTGAVGLVIPAGATVQDPSGNLYKSLDDGTIGIAGVVTITFACTIDGPTAVPDTVAIYQAIPGWDSASVVDGAVGVDTETQAAFELRRAESVANNSMGPIGAIIGAIARVDGILDYYGYSNNTDGTVIVKGVSIPAYSIFVAAAGGSDSDVAEAILSKKGAGAPMVGNTEVTVYDENPLYTAPIPYEITFERPSSLQIAFSVTVINGPQVPNDAETQIKAALQSAFAGEIATIPKARIASTLYAISYVPALAALGSWAVIQNIGINSANTPTATFKAKIVGTTMMVDDVDTGTLAPDQSIIDPDGLITDGTTIVSQSSGPAGGAGTYVVTPSQTVSGATFTGTGSGTTMTVTGVTGTINDNDFITGFGIPADTYIVDQLTGTPGGNGTYQCSATVTTTADPVACWRPVVSVIGGTQSTVVVDGDQIPQLLDNNIQINLV